MITCLVLSWSHLVQPISIGILERESWKDLELLNELGSPYLLRKLPGVVSTF